MQFGFKLWCVCSSDGYLLHAEPYCGKDTNLPETGLGQRSAVVLGMIEKCDLTKVFTPAMDNFFTTLPLFDKLTNMGMYGVDTIQENKLQGASLKKKLHFKRKPGEHFITHLMETICLFPGQTTKLSSFPPTIFR